MNIPTPFRRDFFSLMHVDLLSRFGLVANLKTMSLCIRSALSKKVLSKGGKSQQLLLESVRLKLKFNCIAWALPISSTLSTVPTSSAFSPILHPETQPAVLKSKK